MLENVKMDNIFRAKQFWFYTRVVILQKTMKSYRMKRLFRETGQMLYMLNKNKLAKRRKLKQISRQKRRKSVAYY